MRKSKLVYLPDWSRDNPYQKLLYTEIARSGLPCEGVDGRRFTFRWLWENRKEVSHIHLHWLFGIYDPEGTGLNREKACSFLAKLLLARILRYKVLWTVHNFISHEPTHAALETVVRKVAARLVTHPIVHCDYAKQLVVGEWKVGAQKVATLPHGSYEGHYPNHATRSESRSRLGIPDDAFTFLFFGMVRNYKGIKPLVEHFLATQKRVPHVRLIIAGKPFDAAIKETIEGMARHDNISLFLDYIPDEEVQYYFNASDAVVLPYQNILTSGAAILAVTFAKPLVVPRKGCIPELIGEGMGFLFDHERELGATMLRAVSGTSAIDNSLLEEAARAIRWKNIVDKGYRPLLFGDAVENHGAIAHDPKEWTMAETDHSMKISAIICTHNRSDLLPKAIDSLKSQSLPSSLYEIMVVDNASTDDTKAVCERYGDLANFRYVYEEVPGLSVARNRGLREARGKYVAYMDDDAIASPDWLRLIVEAFETVTPTPASVGGKIEPIWEVPKPEWLPIQHIGCLTILDYGDAPHFLRYPKILYGTNMAYDKEQLRLAGGFRADIGRKKGCLLSCEESDIYQKLASAGQLVYYVPEAYVHHLVPKERVDKRWIYKRQYWQGRSEVLLLAEEMERAELKEEISFCVSEMKNHSVSIVKALLRGDTDTFTSTSLVYYFFGKFRQLLSKIPSSKNTPGYSKAVNDFTFRDISKWSASGEIRVTSAEREVAGKQNAIAISGTGGKDSWNFLQTEKVFLKKNTRYRFSGWMRIDSLSEGKSFFKCEVFQKSKWVKNVDGTAYDLSRVGEWQRLEAEFEAPDDFNAELNIAVDKRPYDNSIEVNMFISDLTIAAVE